LSEPADGNPARRAAILDAATGVFMRYGFKKTSMDDLARAAGLSRQGLYLHFPTKEALFKEGVLCLIAATRAAGRAVLARTELPVDERVLEMFVAVHGQLIGQPGEDHMAELLQTAKQLVGDVANELDADHVADLVRLFRSEGVGGAWKEAGLSVKELAEELVAASHGVKMRSTDAADYKKRMRVAVQLVCGSRPAR
jgi:AcrR family transcriptional regulator